jgi:hypothetical protein
MIPKRDFFRTKFVGNEDERRGRTLDIRPGEGLNLGTLFSI